MLDFTGDQKNDDLAKRFTEMFRRQTEKKAAKALFLGVSPLALAACGGGGDSSVAQILVSGTDGNDTLPNSAANERFEGGLGDDFYTFDLSGTDVISDAGGNDTLRIVWRNKNDVQQIENAYSVGDDLVIEMSGAANVLTVEGAFADATRLENVNYYHADGRWGENATHRIFKLTDEIGSSEIDHMIVGTQTADIIDIQNTSLGGETIWGAGGDDRITTASETQYIRGGDGNDTISSGAGNDWVWGGDGDDTVDGGDGNDFIWGDAGDDILDGGAGDDQVSGGDGNDTIYMSPGADIEDGGDGIDTIILGDWAGAYSGTLNLETGGNFPEGDIDSQNHKVLNFENVTTQVTGNMTIVGTDGDNIIQTGAGDDNITAGDGDDTITTGDGNDTIYAGAGDDVVNAGAGDDVVNNNTAGTDYFNGGDGIDTYAVDVNFTADWRLEVDLESGYSGVEGQYGADLMDTIINFENVTIQAEVNVVIMGDEKANVLTGGTQSDEIGGRSGSDTLSGNGGADTFVFAQSETGTDTITDFDLAEGDKLDLSSYGITTEEAAEALMSDTAEGVNVTIDGSVIVTMTATTVADFAAADGWLA